MNIFLGTAHDDQRTSEADDGQQAKQMTDKTKRTTSEADEDKRSR